MALQHNTASILGWGCDVSSLALFLAVAATYAHTTRTFSGASTSLAKRQQGVYERGLTVACLRQFRAGRLGSLLLCLAACLGNSD